MNISSSFGFPQNGSTLCWAQGIMVTYFALCSFFWTTTLSFTLYSLVHHGKSYLNLYHMHMICWLLPLGLTLVPISSAAYGSPAVNTQWCILVQKPGFSRTYVTVWSYVSYFGWLLLSIIMMVYWGIATHYKIKSMDKTLSRVVQSCYSRVWLYPLAMTSCWILNFLNVENYVNRISNNPIFAGVSMIMGISYGICTALIFLIKSPEARTRWFDYVSIYFPTQRDPSMIPIDFSEDHEIFSSSFSMQSVRGPRATMTSSLGSMFSSTHSTHEGDENVANPINIDLRLSFGVDNNIL